MTNGIETLTDAQLQQIRSWNGRYVTKDGQTYKVNAYIYSRTMGPDWNIYYNPNNTYYNAVYNEINGVLSNAQNQNNTFFRGTSKNSLAGDVTVAEVDFRAGGTVDSTLICKLSWEYQQIEVYLTLAEAGAGSTVNAKLAGGRNQCNDIPMDIFAMPYSDDFEIITARDAGTGEVTASFHTSKEVSLQAAMAVCQAGGVVYDLQLLPYFPYTNIVGETEDDIEEGKIFDNTIDLSVSPALLTEDKDYSWILNSNSGKIGIMF